MSAGAARLHDLPDKVDQNVALRPFRAWVEAVVGEQLELPEKTRVLHGQVPPGPGRPPVEPSEVAASGVVIPEIRPVGVDAYAAHLTPVDDVEEMLLPGRRRPGRPDFDRHAVPPGPAVEPAADLVRYGVPSLGPGRRVAHGQQQRCHMLAVEGHRAGAGSRHRAQRIVHPKSQHGPDLVRVGPAARHPPMDS